MSLHPYPVIIAVSFSLGAAAGFLMHRSDFCLAGMFRDFVLFRRTDMLRSLLLLIAASMVLFELGRQVGLLPLSPFPLLGSPSLANLAGGAIFGLGMVLAGGCVVGTLYKLGAGSLASLVAFAGLVTGSLLYAELHPWWSGFVRATTVFPGRVTLPQMLNLPSCLLTGPLAGVAGWYLCRCFRQGRMRRAAYAEGYLQPWRAALGLAAIGFISWLLVGMPLGVTTAYAKMGAFAGSLFFPEHLASLAYFQVQGLEYVPPLARVAVRGGAGPQFDAIAAIQFPLILGIVLGAAVSSFRLGELRIVWRVPGRQLGAAFAGGLIMGLAARMAPACNVWHLLGGLPVLAGQSLLFALGLWPGAWLGSRILTGAVLKPEG